MDALTENPLRAIGYIRVSTAEQASRGHSLGQQQDRIRAWCQARGMELVGLVYDEGVSASRPMAKREGGARLLKRMAGGEADVVVVVAIDRLFRNAQDGLNTMMGERGQGGIPVQSVTEPIDTTTAMGRFILTVWLAKAQLEREQTCERTLATSRALRKAGRTNGITPFGCRAIDGRLFRDPDTWPVRAQIVAWREDPGYSLATIAAHLEARRVPAPDGGERWHKTTVSRVLRTHHGLDHIPALPESHEPAVSEAATA